MTCRTHGCNRQTTHWRVRCNSCHSRIRRHGHEAQQAITKADLKPYLERVHARIERSSNGSLWPQLEARWGALLDHCRARSAAYRNGRADVRYVVEACEELVKVASDVDARIVVETALAMYVMGNDDARRFKSDDAFWFQLARRVRGLTDMNDGSWYDHDAGKVKRVYRDTPRKATLALAHMLGDAFGAAGIYLARLDEQEAEERRKRHADLAAALATAA
ncbi:MAG TPA: hypothetical protein VGG27_07375 [Magnetospirillaceae bacterium]|jgi:hypothetical protein